ncbi:unnamed protein product [Euphydryas editha]|uniref:Nuclease HARBI1 n=1 Tax=Euphydryas editha TaxID=104508 RepID=A0AAU9UTX7_EUPED|nr:unnamed protein product [Euphydryas editha]
MASKRCRRLKIEHLKKLRIQNRFHEILGLNVDKQRQGGTSTDGNMARLLFQHAEEVSEITGVNLNIIKLLHTILKLLSSGYTIRTKKIRQFCLRTAWAFVFNYPWFNMPTTLQKILIHGHQIVEKVGVAIGLLSEDAEESRNKDIRQYRQQFSRKFSRKMEDTYYSLMISSDPYITRVIRPRRNRVIRSRPNYFDILDDVDFRARFHLTKRTAANIWSLIESDIKTTSNYNFAITSMQCLLITLHYFATGTFLTACGVLRGVTKASACRIIHKVSEAIAKLRPLFVKFPADTNNISQEFYEIARFPRVVGVIDCTHINMLKKGVNLKRVCLQWANLEINWLYYATKEPPKKLKEGVLVPVS